MSKKKKYDSDVNIWTGPRGGGKSVSMTVESIIGMVDGRKVFSNYPIAFDFRYSTGKIEHFASLPFDEDAFLTQDKSMDDAIIVWDEMAISLGARDFQSVSNKLAGKLITLLRHQHQSLFIASQFLFSLDKSIRIQCDSEIYCFDLSFKYPNLKRGECIAHNIKDMSGRGSGEPYNMTGQTFTRTLDAEPFWNCYDSEAPFDLLKAMQKRKINIPAREITRRDLLTQEGNVIEKVKDAMDSLNVDKMHPEEVRSYLSEQGINLDPVTAGKYLKAAGWRRGRQNAVGERMYERVSDLVGAPT
jgi:hypothetical protein